MQNEEIAKEIKSLIQLTIDMIEAYQQALKEIKSPYIHKKTFNFMQDYQEHIALLNDVMKKMGHETPSYKRNLKGFLIEGFTLIQSKLGEKMALKALLINEKLARKKYEEALNYDLPPYAREVVEKNYHDEKIHFGYFNKVISAIEK